MTRFGENVPKVEKTTIEIRLKVGNNYILNKYLKPIIFLIPIRGLPLYGVLMRLVALVLQASSLNTAFFCSRSRGFNLNSVTLNNARIYELRIFLFSQKYIFEVRAL